MPTFRERPGRDDNKTPPNPLIARVRAREGREVPREKERGVLTHSGCHLADVGPGHAATLEQVVPDGREDNGEEHAAKLRQPRE